MQFFTKLRSSWPESDCCLPCARQSPRAAIRWAFFSVLDCCRLSAFAWFRAGGGAARSEGEGGDCTAGGGVVCAKLAPLIQTAATPAKANV
jgi:hypothetical protein